MRIFSIFHLAFICVDKSSYGKICPKYSNKLKNENTIKIELKGFL